MGSGNINDIAILELDRPSEYKPITLFTRQTGITDLEAAGQMLTTSGWGRTSESGSVAGKLQKVTVPLIKNQKCQEMYPAEQIDMSVLCAGGPGTDACNGDSGGPIFGTDNVYGDDYLVGLVSWGYGCARAQLPGVYARISHFKQWICDNSDGLYGCYDRYGTKYYASFWLNFWIRWYQNYLRLGNLSSLFTSRSGDRATDGDNADLAKYLPRGVDIALSGDAADAAAQAAAQAIAQAITQSDGRRGRGRGGTSTSGRSSERQSSSGPSEPDFDVTSLLPAEYQAEFSSAYGEGIKRVARQIAEDAVGAAEFGTDPPTPAVTLPGRERRPGSTRGRLAS